MSKQQNTADDIKRRLDELDPVPEVTAERRAKIVEAMKSFFGTRGRGKTNRRQRPPADRLFTDTNKNRSK